MKRVVHVTTVPESLQFIAGQAPVMRARGYELAAISSPGEALERFGAAEGVPVYGVPMPRAITPGADLRSLAKLTAQLVRLAPDLVHAHTPKGGLLGMLAAKAARVPVRLYHMRGLPFVTQQGWKRELLVTTERVSCGVADHVLCVSHSLREVALGAKLCPPGKLEVLLGGSGQGVDSEGRFNPERVGAGARAEVRRELGLAGDALVVGFVGRLVRDKGVGELTTAWLAVRERFPAARLVLVGRFEERDALGPEVRRALERDERVVLAGFRRDTERLYAAFDVVVLPTYREGFPNVPLEAASMQVPVIATRVPGCVDAVVDGVTGRLVAAGDDQQLREALAELLGDAALRERLGAQARQRVRERFRREAIWDAIADTYDRLSATSRLGRRSATP